MKTFILKTSTFISVILLLFTAFYASSCKKDKMCHGKVTVVDTAGSPVPSATVVASYGSSTNSNVSATTDGSGIATIDLKLPAILNLTATSSSFPGMTGKGILRLDEPGKSTDVTVTIKP
jgi:hypothetical protein